MEKINNEHALSFIDSFLTEVKEEKTAEESPITVSTSDTGGEAAGTVPASVEGSQDNSPEKTKEEEGNPTQGEFGKEKSQDIAGAIAPTGVEEAAAENNEKVDDERAAGDFGQGAVESPQIDTPSYVEAEKMKVAGEINMKNELERAHTLSNAIVEKIAANVELEKEAKYGLDTAKKLYGKGKSAVKATTKAAKGATKATTGAAKTTAKTVSEATKKGTKAATTAGKAVGKAVKNPLVAGAAGAAAGVGGTVAVQKALEKKEAEIANEAFLKEAADAAYHDFVTSYQLGLIKRAEDEEAIQEALGINPEEAAGLLDEVATEEPEAVMPAEEMPAEAMGEELPAEAMGEELPAEAMGEELPAEAMGEEGGIDEEALLAALVEAGVTPEELEQAVSEVGAEDEAMQVQAAEQEQRMEAIKDVVRTVRN